MERRVHVISILVVLMVLVTAARSQDEIKLFIDGQQKTVPIKEMEGDLWVPLKEFTQAMGAKYAYNPEEKVVMVQIKTVQASPKPEKPKPIQYRYFLRGEISWFAVEVTINGKKVADLPQKESLSVNTDVTKFLVPGKNTVRLRYQALGKEKSLCPGLRIEQQFTPRSSRAKMSYQWNPNDEDLNGEMVFTFVAD